MSVFVKNRGGGKEGKVGRKTGELCVLRFSSVCRCLLVCVDVYFSMPMFVNGFMCART